MRYLIFGDVHGNLPALEKLLRIEKGSYDKIICHGDVVNYAPWSNECVSLLSTIPDVITLKGNHEENFLNGVYPGGNDVAKAFFEFCYPSFKEFEIIENYGVIAEIENFIVKHTINNSYIFPDSDLSKLNLRQNFIIGHSHYNFDRMWKEFRIINTGSLGQNRKFLNIAEYVIYDSESDKIWLKSFIYNIDTVIDQMENDNYPLLCLNYYKTKNRK